MEKTKFHAYYPLKTLFGTLSYPHITENIMNYLSASEISFMRYMLKIEGDFLYPQRYTNPLKDIDPTMTTVNDFIEKGYTILLIGPDTYKLMERIKNPHTYWKKIEDMYETKQGDDKHWMKMCATYENRIKCWLLCFNPYSAVLENLMLVRRSSEAGNIFIDAFLPPEKRMAIVENNFMLQKHNLPNLGSNMIEDLQSTLATLLYEVTREPGWNKKVEMPVGDLWPCSLQPTFVSSSFEYGEKIIMGRTVVHVEWMSLLSKYKPGESPMFTYIDASSNPLEIIDVHPNSDINTFIYDDLRARRDRVRFAFKIKNPKVRMGINGNNHVDMTVGAYRAGLDIEDVQQELRELVLGSPGPEYTYYHVDIQLRRPLTGP